MPSSPASAPLSLAPLAARRRPLTSPPTCTAGVKAPGQPTPLLRSCPPARAPPGGDAAQKAPGSPPASPRPRACPPRPVLDGPYTRRRLAPLHQPALALNTTPRPARPARAASFPLSSRSGPPCLVSSPRPRRGPPEAPTKTRPRAPGRPHAAGPAQRLGAAAHSVGSAAPPPPLRPRPPSFLAAGPACRDNALPGGPRARRRRSLKAAADTVGAPRAASQARARARSARAAAAAEASSRGAEEERGACGGRAHAPRMRSLARGPGGSRL